MPIKIELRNVAYNARLSEETPAYKADVWIDGVKAGTTRNSGTGGANITEPHALGERLKAHAATLPKETDKHGTYKQTEESLINAAFIQWLAARDLRRMMRSKFVMAEGGKIFTIKGDRALIAKRYPAAVVLNEIPFEQALVEYLKVAS